MYISLFGEEMPAPEIKPEVKQKEKSKPEPPPPAPDPTEVKGMESLFEGGNVMQVEQPVMQAPPKEEIAPEPTTTSEKPSNKKEKKPKKATEPPQSHGLPEGWVGEKHYYAIGDVASLLGANTSQIRFWTNEFEIEVRTTRKGDRLYTPQQVKLINHIQHLLKEKGFTLSGAKAKLKSRTESTPADAGKPDLKEQLMKIKTKLTALKQSI